MTLGSCDIKESNDVIPRGNKTMKTKEIKAVLCVLIVLLFLLILAIKQK